MSKLINRCSNFFFFIAFSSILLLQTAFAQKIEIVSDSQNVHLDQDFIITITIPFQRKIKIGNFPEISDFSKKETIFNQQDSLIVIYQHYRPRKTGNFQLEPFKVYINNESLDYTKTTHIRVIKSAAVSPKEEEKEDDGFEPETIQSKLYITTNKTEVYKNETFEAKIYLDISSEGDPEYNFIDLHQQLSVLTKKIIPKSGLHQFQNFGVVSLDTISNDDITKTYLLANILIAPGTADSIVIPSLQLDFLTYTKKRSKGLIERTDKVITLHTAPYTIQVNSLPEKHKHLTPGNFTFKELSNKNHITANHSFTYQFIVTSASENLFYSKPLVNQNHAAIVIPEPNFKNDSNTTKNQHFSYQIIPTQTGRLELKNLFYWPFFNTKTNKPDTLRPTKVIQVYGKPGQKSLNYRDTPFYKEIDSESTTLRPIRKDYMLNLFTNLVILFMFAVTAILIIRK